MHYDRCGLSDEKAQDAVPTSHLQATIDALAIDPPLRIPTTTPPQREHLSR